MEDYLEAALQDFQELAAKLPWEKALSAWELNNSLKKKKRRKKQGDGGKERKQPGVSTGVDVLGEEEQGNTEKHCEDSSTIKCLEEKKAGVTKELDPTVPDTTVEDVQAKGSEKLPECPSSQAQSVEEVQSSQHLGSDAATQPVTEVKPEVKECDGEADTLPITEVKTGGKEGDLNGDASNVLKFRVTCNRAGDKHSFTSNEVEMWFGGAIQEHFQWKADMTNFDVEVLPNISFRELLVGIALTEKSFNRKNITHFGPQTLPPTLVYGMLRLCDLQPSDVIIDLMCGTGAIPIEGVSEWPGCFFLAGDNNTQAVSRTASNINSLLRKQQSQESAPQGFPIDVAQWDISSLPLRSGSVDAIVMVIPFGRWIDSKKYWDLYPAWLQEMSRVCRAGTGRAVVFAYNRTYFFKALAKAGHLWKKMHTVWVNIGGLHAGVYLLKRTAHDAHECSRERQEEDRPADTVSSSKAE
ncbi:tRNA (guanine(6)-N(2))-methyltransferase THUMP3-like [Rhinophrynus dorsalis]